MSTQKADGEDGCGNFHQAGEGGLDTTINGQHRTDGSEHRTDGSEHLTDGSEDRTDSSEDMTDDSKHHSECSEHRTDSVGPWSGDSSKSRTFENQDTCTADRDTCQERTGMAPGVLQTVGDTSSGDSSAQSVNESDCAGDEEGNETKLRHSDDGSDMVGGKNDGSTDVKDDADKMAVHSGDNSVGEDFAEDQHSLSGPHRGHQTRRQQRRRSAATLPPPQRHLNLPASVLAQWRNVGRQWGVDNDDDIARILMRNYEDMLAGRPPRPPPRQRCPDCGEVLVPLPCGGCGPHQHSTRLAHDPGRGRSSGGKGSSCGRC